MWRKRKVAGGELAPPPKRGKCIAAATTAATTTTTTTANNNNNSITHAPWFDERKRVRAQYCLPIPSLPQQQQQQQQKQGRLAWLGVDAWSASPAADANSQRYQLQPLPIPPAPAVPERVNVARRSTNECPATHVLRTYKIKLKPIRKQRAIYQRWFRTCRLVRKLTLDELLKQNPDGFQKAPPWKDVKKRMLHADDSPLRQHKYARKYVFDHTYASCDMKESTVHSLCAAIGSTIESLKAKKVKEAAVGGRVLRREQVRAGRFHLKHQTQQDRYQSIDIESNGGTPPVKLLPNGGGFTFATRLNPTPVQARSRKDYDKLYHLLLQHNRDFPPKKPIKSDSGIVGCPCAVTLKYDRYRGYFLCIPYHKPRQQQQQQPASQRRLAVALDPGVRTFQTTYDSEGASTKFGHRSVSRLMKHARRVDKLQSRIDRKRKSEPEVDGQPLPIIIEDLDMAVEIPVPPQVAAAAAANNRKCIRKLRQQQHHLLAKIENLKESAHWELAAHLCSRYDNIILPPFKTSQMVARFHRKIRSSTVREMLHWSHYAFKQRLQHKAEECGTRVHVHGEHYTSKACGVCGLLDRNLGGVEFFRCVSCGYECDRDRGAARSIYNKNFDECAFGQYIECAAAAAPHFS